MRRQLLPDKQKRGARDAPVSGQVRTIQKRLQRPCGNFFRRHRLFMLFRILPTGIRQRHLVKIVIRRIVHNLRRPVRILPLSAYRVQFLKAQRRQILSRTGIVVSLPRNGDAPRCRWYLKHHDTPVRHVKLVYAAEADGGICALRNLILDTPRTIHGIRRNVIVGTNDFSRLVVNAEHKPGRLKATQVRFIRQRREVLPDLITRKALAAALELDDLIFPIGDQPAQKSRHFLFCHTIPPVNPVNPVENSRPLFPAMFLAAYSPCLLRSGRRQA